MVVLDGLDEIAALQVGLDNGAMRALVERFDADRGPRRLEGLVSAPLPSAPGRECVKSAQTVPEIASRGSFWPPEIASLTLARILSIGWPAASSTLRIEVLGCLVTIGIMSSIAASIPAVAAWQRASICLLPL